MDSCIGGIEPLQLNFGRNVELKMVFSNMVNQDSL